MRLFDVALYRAKREARERIQQEWHRWFAWRPVVANGVLVWLEFVERKFEWEHLSMEDGSGKRWSYRTVQPQPQSRVQHVKRGSTYAVLGEAEVQISSGDFEDQTGHRHKDRQLLAEGDKLVIYRSEKDGHLWARFPDEFNDGRFKEIGS